MRYLFILLFLSGCASLVTSDMIRENAIDACFNVPALDMQRDLCIYAHIVSDCTIHNYDAKICGQLQRQR
jgi:hypothetical protein